jgi:TonB-linked SusC/RagA family outer membrane protein
MNLYAFNLGVRLKQLPLSILTMMKSSYSAGNHGAINKISLVMKLIIIIMTSFLLQVSASGFAQKLSYAKQGATLKEIFSEIRKQTGYFVLFSDKDVNAGKKIDVNFENTDLKDVLEKVISQESLGYTIDNKNIIIKKKEKIPLPANLNSVKALINVQGQVVDSLGVPLAGATVFIEELRIARRTDEKGIFEFFNVPEGSIIMVNYVGYAMQKAKASRSFMKIVMRQSTFALAGVEVYNTGFQVLSKERATGSFGKPDMEIFAQRTGTMDVISRLEGLVPGMAVAIGANNSTSNRVGNGVATRKSLIRGNTSVQLATDPLYVINGSIVPDISSINLDDIDNITVLKDAAAAAIWGAKAANGVVVITTKSGASNARRVSFSYSGFVNYNGVPDFSYGRPMNSQQYIQTARETFDPVAYPFTGLLNAVTAPHDKILYDQFRNLITADVANQKLDSLAAINNQSQIEDLFYRPAITSNHTLSASGGSDSYSFYASVGYTGSQSNTVGDKNDSYKFNLTQNFTAGNRLKVTLRASLINTVSSRKNPLNVNSSFLPYQLFQDAGGNNLNMNFLTGYSDERRLDYQTRSRINLDYNPVNEIDLGYARTNNISVNLTANATLKLWKGLSFVGTYGYQRAPGFNEAFTDAQTLSYRKTALSLTVAPTVGSVPVYNIPLTGGSYTTNNNLQRNFTVRNQLVYEASFRKGKDRLNLQLGNDIQETVIKNTVTNSLGFDPLLNSIEPIDYARLKTGISGTVTGFGSYGSLPFSIAADGVSRFIAYFGLASYSIDNKYSLDFSFRQDYSNQFGKDLAMQNKPIYSVGGKWRIKQEKFMQQVSWLEDLNLRATYGVTGNSPSAGTASLDDVLRVVTGNSSAPLYSGNALELQSAANKKITWEATHTLNLGLDFSLLNGRLSGSIDAYKKNTDQLIGPYMLNPFTGFSLTTGNAGKLRNEGIEVNLRSVNIAMKDFRWSTGIVMSYNKNKVLEYYQSASALAGTSVPSLGYDRNPLWAYRYAGLDNMGDPQVYLADGTITKAPFVTLGKDQKYMGTTQPLFTGGMTNNFSYKGLSLALNMIYNFGAVMRKEVITSTIFNARTGGATNFNGSNLPTYFLDRWKKPGDEAFTDIPVYLSNSTANRRRNLNYYVNGDNNVASASYIKLRDVTLSYDLQPKVTRFLKIQRASIFLQATNFMVWKANKDGLDPEVPRSLGAALPGHSYSMGVNISL